MNRFRGALVGAFVLGGLLLFGGGLFLIGDRRLLFTPQFELNSTFGKVTGCRWALASGWPGSMQGRSSRSRCRRGLPSRSGFACVCATTCDRSCAPIRSARADRRHRGQCLHPGRRRHRWRSSGHAGRHDCRHRSHRVRRSDPGRAGDVSDRHPKWSISAALWPSWR